MKSAKGIEFVISFISPDLMGSIHPVLSYLQTTRVHYTSPPPPHIAFLGSVFLSYHLLAFVHEVTLRNERREEGRGGSGAFDTGHD